MTYLESDSPADMENVSVHHFLTEVNDVVTENFESFLTNIKKLNEHEYCRLTLLNLVGEQKTVSLMPNKFFKTVELRRSEEESCWKVREL